MTDSALEGRHVLVTGGGSGIGLACAAQMRADGAIVTLMGRTEQKLAAAASQLRAAPGSEVRTAVGDVTNEDHVTAAVAAATDASWSPP